MTKQIWLNLPVKEVAKSKAFFTSLGFSFNEARTNEQMGCMLVGEHNFPVMLFKEDLFRGFVQHEMTDTKQSSEVLISIDAESRDEVDALAKKAAAAGGVVFAAPAENQGWMYGCAFTDLDGHRWNVLYMDTSKLPK
jgi:predicted lactoylglutathione lyase